MFIPKKQKFRKHHLPRLQGRTTRGDVLAYGTYGLKAAGRRWVSSRQLEAARRAMTRYFKRGGKSWIRIFPDNPITDKGGEVGMGKGKGPVERYVSAVKPGTILIEMDGVTEDIAREALRLAGSKLPMKTQFIRKAQRQSHEAS
ncbi:MAG: 50S ribosomal protein L16 [Candidatus Kerfeldbacteria bacterium]|nr:50S ribosomal protein L16 [Candidatus Kerfeldbacteria bacterium]